MNVRTEVVSLVSARARVSDFAELTKPRITTLVVLTTWVAYIVAARGSVQPWQLLHTLFGTALVCGGTSALNQVWERDRDAMMRRTASRPLPAGRLPSGEALAFGVVVSLIGLFDLALFVNPLTALVAGSTLIAYVFAYTPLKTRTWWSTSVGAIPGAAPPLIGWAAARGTLDAGAAALFAIQFIWQLPHFYAIAWMYREDYARAGFKMLSVLDPEGTRTRRQIMAWAALLLPVSLLPVVVGANGWIYAGGAILLGTGFLVLALGMRKRNEVSSARRVFLGSILYLPLLFGLMVLDTLLA